MIDKSTLKSLMEQCGVSADYSDEMWQFANACAKRATIDIQGENTRLRAALANSELPCAYCTLSKEDWNKCQSGFPGCGRADDAMGCAGLGAVRELTRMTVGELLPFPQHAPTNENPHLCEIMVNPNTDLKRFDVLYFKGNKFLGVDGEPYWVLRSAEIKVVHEATDFEKIEFPILG